MKRCFIAAALGVALMIAGCSKSSNSGGGLLSKAESALTPSDPWTEFALMSAARGKATSWRSKMVMNMAGQAMEMDSEVVCPDKQHAKVVTGGKVTMESYMIGNTMYMNMGGQMMKVPSHSSGPGECRYANSASAPSTTPSKFSFGSLPNFKDLSNGLDNLEKLKQNVNITKGGVSTVEGDSCQEWNVAYNDPQSKQGYQSNYCVGILDHLPRRMSVDTGAGKMEMTYWDWNKNISINPPIT